MAVGLFITGTGTGVGKTYVAALVARALRATGKRIGVYKPVASGCQLFHGRPVSADAATLWDAAGRSGTVEQVCPQCFLAPLAPHLAARAEGRDVDRQLLREGLQFWQETCDVVLVEGAGGLMSPLSAEDYNADLAAAIGYPLVVVSENALGTINATLQTLITARAYGGLNVAGVVLNSPRAAIADLSHQTNAQELAQRSTAQLLAVVGHAGEFDRHIDWYALADGRSGCA